MSVHGSQSGSSLCNVGGKQNSPRDAHSSPPQDCSLDGCCRLCHRPKSTPNPCPCRARTGGIWDSETLPFANATTCVSCNNYVYGPLKSCPPDQVAEKLNEGGPPARATYREGLFSYEAVFAVSHGKQVKAGHPDIMVPMFLQNVVDDGTQRKKIVAMPRHILWMLATVWGVGANSRSA